MYGFYFYSMTMKPSLKITLYACSTHVLNQIIEDCLYSAYILVTVHYMLFFSSAIPCRVLTPLPNKKYYVHKNPVTVRNPLLNKTSLAPYFFIYLFIFMETSTHCDEVGKDIL